MLGCSWAGVTTARPSFRTQPENMGPAGAARGISLAGLRRSNFEEIVEGTGLCATWGGDLLVKLEMGLGEGGAVKCQAWI